MPELVPFIDLLSRIGGTGLLAVGMWMLITGRLVTQGQYNDVKAQRDRLLDLALEQTKIAQEAVAKAAIRLKGNGRSDEDH